MKKLKLALHRARVLTDEEHPDGGGPESTPKLIERKASSGKGYVEARFDVTLKPAGGPLGSGTEAGS